MAPAIKELERAVIAGELQHGGHPVLRWNVENVVVREDSAGNRMFHKGKSRDRIDGAVALAMAVGRAFSPPQTSIYSNVSRRPNGFLIF